MTRWSVHHVSRRNLVRIARIEATPAVIIRPSPTVAVGVPRVTAQQRSDLMPDSGSRGLGVSDRDEDGVQRNQRERPRRQPAMPAQQAAEPEDTLDEREPA